MLVALDNVSFRYGTGTFRLGVPSFSVASGEAVGVIGPSGSGKTTLLHLVAGILLPERGTVEVAGAKVSALSDPERRDHRITKMGLVFQEFELLEYLNVLDNVLLPYRITGALALDRDVVARARLIAGEVGIGDKLDRNVRRLSHGERQRVAICRALVPEPVLLLADEPTGNLDPKTKGRVFDLLLDHARRRGTTLLTVTHDHGLLDRFDRIVDVEGWHTAADQGGMS